MQFAWYKSIFHAPRFTETTKHACVYHILLNTKNNSERPVDALAVKNVNYSLTHSLKSRDANASKKIKVAEHWQVYIGLANCRRRSLTIMTSRTMRTQLHPSGTKASSGVFEDQEQRDFQKTFITQRVHCMCWHNARRYKNQYSFILDWRDFAHCDNILSAGSHHPDIFLPPFQSW